MELCNSILFHKSGPANKQHSNYSLILILYLKCINFARYFYRGILRLYYLFGHHFNAPVGGGRVISGAPARPLEFLERELRDGMVHFLLSHFLELNIYWYLVIKAARHWPPSSLCCYYKLALIFRKHIPCSLPSIIIFFFDLISTITREIINCSVSFI